MFLSVQGQSVGGVDMPDDYARDLRKQLGYRDVGGDGHNGEEEVPEQTVEFELNEVDAYGNLGFSIEGPVPKDFLADFGITMSASYGFRLSREFSLVNPGAKLESFLKKAKVAKIKVSSILEGEPHLLKMVKQAARMEIQHALSGDRVVRRMLFLIQRVRSLMSSI